MENRFPSTGSIDRKRAALAVLPFLALGIADVILLLAWGIDGLISNRPDVAVRMRDSFVRGVRL